MNTRSFPIPNSWALTNLEECVEVLDNQRVPINSDERDKRKGDVPYYGATGQVGWIDDYLFNEELILLGEDGAPFLDPLKNKAYIISGKSWVNNHAHVLKAINGITLNRYIANYLNIINYSDYISGTTRYKLNQSPMRKIPVLIPPLAEQHRIVAKIEELFTKLDAGVESQKKAKEQLRQYRQAVLKIALEGKLTEEWRDINKGKIEPAELILEKINRHLPNKNSIFSGIQMPKVPEGWTWMCLEGLAYDSGYGTSEKCDNRFNGTPVLRIPNISNGNIDLSDLKYTKEYLKVNDECYLSKGDFLIIRTNGSKDLIGKAALIKSNFNSPHYFASYLIRYRLFNIGCLPLWINIIWNSPRMRSLIEKMAATSAGQYNISMSSLNKVPIEIPPLAEQVEIIKQVENQFTMIDEIVKSLDNNIAYAETLRYSILVQAFSGKLVPQDPDDEPAEKLLEHIRAERAQKAGGKERASGRKRGRQTAIVES